MWKSIYGSTKLREMLNIVTYVEKDSKKYGWL